MKNIARSKVMNLKLRKMAPLVAAVIALCFVSSVTAQKHKEPKVGKPVIWADPGKVELMDFIGGAAGQANTPKPPFTFVEESMSGSNPKVRVRVAKVSAFTSVPNLAVHSAPFASRTRKAPNGPPNSAPR